MTYAAPFWSPAEASAILFDWDGVIAETKLDFSPIREKYYGARRAMLLEEASTLAPEVRASLMRDLEEVEMEGAYRSTLVPGIGDILDWVASKNIPWAVVSRNCRRSILAAAEATGVDLPAVVRSRDDGEAVKPDPPALLETCAALGVPPSQTLFIGDFIYDMIGARRTGMRGVLVRKQIEPDWSPWLECSYNNMGELLAELNAPSKMIPWEYIETVAAHGRDFLAANYGRTLAAPLDATPDLATWILEAARLGVGCLQLPDAPLSPDTWKKNPALSPSSMGKKLSEAASELLAVRFPFARVTDSQIPQTLAAPSDASQLPDFLKTLV